MLSIIVLTYKRNNDLELLFKSLSRQKDLDKFEFELILIDNSTVSEAEPLANEYTKKLHIVYVSTSVNLWVAWWRNLGIDSSKYKYILFIDDDNEFNKDNILNWIFKDIDYLNSKSDLWAIKYTNEDPIYKNWKIVKYEIAWIWTKSRKPDKYLSIPHFTWCWVLLKKSLFTDYWYFDIDFEAEEDVEFSYRISSYWMRILLNRDIVIRHNRTTNSRNVEWWIVKWVTSHLKILYKYNSKPVFLYKFLFYFLVQYAKYYRFIIKSEIKMGYIAFYRLFYIWFRNFVSEIPVKKYK
jgi:glycosyltransferase involved in cell wall biosynthesis